MKTPLRLGKLFLCSTLMLASYFLIAQEAPPILIASKPEAGIYKDFDEFVNNAPSIRRPFQIVCQSGVNKIERGTADYRMLLLDSASKRKEIKNFWGASDGKDVYINEFVYGGPVNFKKFHGLGRYCYFKGTQINTQGSALSAGVMGGAIAGGLTAAAVEIDGDYPYILNINNGKIFLLDKPLLKVILKKDAELNTLYEEEAGKSKKNTLLSYIVQYNERNAHEIKYNRIEPIDIIFYRKEKKERTDSLFLNIGDTTISLGVNSIKQFQSTRESIDVCVDENCKTIPLEKHKINYIACSWESDAPNLEKVESKVGEFNERKIRLTNENKK